MIVGTAPFVRGVAVGEVKAEVVVVEGKERALPLIYRKVGLLESSDMSSTES